MLQVFDTRGGRKKRGKTGVLCELNASEDSVDAVQCVLPDASRSFDWRGLTRAKSGGRKKRPRREGS